MLSFEDFEMSINYLAEALTWRISDFTRQKFYEQIRQHYTLDDLMSHAMTFCDRGKGNPAEFLSYLKQERRRQAGEGRDVAEVVGSGGEAPRALSGDIGDPHWKMPCIEQIRIAKWMAMRKRKWAISFEDVDVTERDLDTIRLTRLSRLAPMEALYQVIDEATGDRRVKRSSMTSLSDALAG